MANEAPKVDFSTEQLFKSRRVFPILAALLILLIIAAFSFSFYKPPPELKQITLDYAFYNPSSLVLKKFGWLEESLQAKGIKVKWVHSAGSNRAIQYLNGGNSLELLTGEEVQFGSTAGLAAVIARAKGVPIKAVYVFSRPEWTALVVKKDSPIRSVAELKGKSIAVTLGTDPHMFLLRSLHEIGLKSSDVKIVQLQHAQGRDAMEHDRVDAWAGLDPLMADSELNAGSRLIYRNKTFNTYGFLNVTESFAQEHSDTVQTVIAAYERARKWIIANPDEAARILADEANISLEVARLQLIQRTDLSQPVIGQEHIEALRLAGHVLVEEGVVSNQIDVREVLTKLIDSKYVKAVIPPVDQKD